MSETSVTSVFKPIRPVLYLATIALVVTILSHSRAVLLPLALSVLLAFVLMPGVRALERRGLNRLVAVALLLLIFLAAIGGFGYVLVQQFSDLSRQLSAYSGSMRQKVARLRGTGAGPIANIQKVVDEVAQELQQEKGEPVEPVRVVAASDGSFFDDLSHMLLPVIEPLAAAGLVVVLVAFILMQREDLRNRLIRLVGLGKITLTTRTMDEAAQRISRYLLSQTMINFGFGAVAAVGLFLIGLPYALLWGFAAAVLRFVPYIGSALALIFPTVLAFVLFEGWTPMLEVVALYLVLDALAANLVEPLVIGHHTGVSSIALLVSAMFWTWVWGPIGLIMATPMTVCLAVLGKHVPQLEFLAVLLGDEPALEKDVSFYQRLLARDEDEAEEIVEHEVATTSREQVFDDVLVPALILAERDYVRGEIAQADLEFVQQAVKDAIGDVAAAKGSDDTDAKAANEETATDSVRAHILAVPARHASDELALDMIAQLFDPLTCTIDRMPAGVLVSEVIDQVQQSRPDLVCILDLPPGGVAHARYLCKRLRARHPDVHTLIVRPTIRSESSKTVRRLQEAGADHVALSLADAVSQATDLLLRPLVRPVAANATATVST